jgi:hypothetical protein
MSGKAVATIIFILTSHRFLLLLVSHRNFPLGRPGAEHL